jgi:hypothetical protein
VAALLVLVLALTTTGSSRAGTPCGQRVLDDWSNDGTVEGTFASSCYRQALSDMPTDMRLYTSASDDIVRALARKKAVAAHLPGRSLQAARLRATPIPAAVVRRGRSSIVPAFAAAALLAVATLLVVRARRRAPR